MDEATEAYLRARHWQEDDLLRELREDLERRGPTIQVSVETGRLLAVWTAAVGARRVLEVGTLFGYSGVWIARALAVRRAASTPWSCPTSTPTPPRNGSPGRGSPTGSRCGEGPRSRRSPSSRDRTTWSSWTPRRPSTSTYAEHAARLLRTGGSLLADNAIWSGRIADPAVTDDDTEGIRRFHEHIAEDPAWDATVLPVGDGVAVAVKHPGD